MAGGFWTLVFGHHGGGSATVELPPDVAGLDYTVPDRRLHYVVPDCRLHYVIPDSRLHFDATDEEGI